MQKNQKPIKDTSQGRVKSTRGALNFSLAEQMILFLATNDPNVPFDALVDNTP